MEEKSLHENLPYEEMYYVELEIGALPSHSSRQWAGLYIWSWLL